MMVGKNIPYSIVIAGAILLAGVLGCKERVAEEKPFQKGTKEEKVLPPDAKASQDKFVDKGQTPQVIIPAEKRPQFKVPVLLWEREFDPPLIDISDQNSAGEYIAIQGGGKEGRPTKILFLDRKGKTIREIPLGRKEKRKIPPEQVWLTYYGEQWRDEKFKKSLKAGKEIETITDRAYVSGNGEHYAIMTKDTAYEKAGPSVYHSAWHEFAYYDKNGKVVWNGVPKSNYSFNRAYISYDGKRVLIIDQAIVDYFGQRWYLYDDKGNLLKDEDHLVSTIVDQAERDKEAREWLEEVKISQNGKYIGYIKGEHNDSKAGLMDDLGRILWEKQLDKIHSRVGVADNGNVAVTAVKTIYFVSTNGEILAKIGRGIVPVYPISQSGKKLISEGELGNQNTIGDIKIYESITGNLILNFKIGDLLHNPQITWVNQIDFFHNDSLMLISYNIMKKTDSIGIYSMGERSVIWKKENLGEKILFRFSQNGDYLSLFDSPSYPEIKKVFIFDLLGGKNS